MNRYDIRRNRDRRLVAGVCAGVSSRTGIDVAYFRLGVLVLTVAGGLGLLIYLVAWATLPLRPPDQADPSATVEPDAVQSLAVVIGLVGMLMIARSIGMWINDWVAGIGVCVAVGVALVWGRANGFGELGGRRPLRIAVGVALVAGGVVALLVLSGDVRAASWALVAAGTGAAGVALLFGANLARLAEERDLERRERIRVLERAEIAAHLHDGVLQTLTLIQKSSDDPRRVAQLARRQERELRQWLHGTVRSPEGTLASALGDEVASVEDDHGDIVELVCVGDAPLFDGTAALIAAVREATVNAVRHSGAGRVDVYVEVEEHAVSAFVRDRGQGFDPDAIEHGRRGVRESIIGRMERAGGSAQIKSTPGVGTEVRLSLPRLGDRTTTVGAAGW